MPIVFSRGDNPTKERITLIHNQPDKLSEERKAEGVEVAEVPEKDEYKISLGYKAVPYVNTETGEVFYEYLDTPESVDAETKRANLPDKAQRLASLDAERGNS